MDSRDELSGYIGRLAMTSTRAITALTTYRVALDADRRPRPIRRLVTGVHKLMALPATLVMEHEHSRSFTSVAH